MELATVEEGVLWRSAVRHGQCLGQALWTILQDAWPQAKTVWASPVIH